MAFMVPYVAYIANKEDLPEDEYPEIISDDDPFEPGWYAWLTAPGFMDRTDPMGPFETGTEALKELCDFYEVDESGDPLS